MMLRVFIAGAIFLMPAVAHAGCYTYYPYVQTYYPPPQIIIKEKYFVEYVPAFFTGWAPGLAAAYTKASQTTVEAPTKPTCEEELKTIKQQLATLEQRLSAGANTVPPATPPQALPLKGSILVGACATCHDKSVAATKGKGWVLTENDKIAVMSSEMLGKVMKEVSSGRMPKGGKLSNEQFNSLMNELVEISSK